MSCKKYYLCVLFTFIFQSISDVAACPLVDGLVDLGCDQTVKISVTGDSIVRGRGDPNLNDDSGGYVLDLKKYFPDVVLENLGIPGVTSEILFLSFRKNAPKMSKTWQKLKDSDYIIIEVGTNDYWDDRPPAAVVRYIWRLRNYLEDFCQKSFGTRPIIAVATLPPTRRGFQQPFIDSVNKQLLLPYNQSRLNVLVRFDKLSKAIVSDDNLHPSGRGYKKMASVAAAAIKGPMQEQARKARIDADLDGIYDDFEVSTFGTDPLLYDTDGDGLSDGAEVFIYKTDPLKSDTDGDGKTDGEEVLAGTNPLDPLV